MTDQITLKRNVSGEFAPQYWTLSGGEFDAMLGAVKALPQRQYVERERAWSVTYAGIVCLREAGYTVKRNSDVKIELYLGMQSIEKLERGANVEIVLNYRTPGERETWGVASNIAPKYHTTLHFDFAPEQIEGVAAEIESEMLSEKYRAEYCHNSAISILSMRALRTLNEDATKCYKEHRGKQTLDEHNTAVEKVWQFICEVK